MTLLIFGILMIAVGVGWLLYYFHKKIQEMQREINQINAKLDLNGIKSDGNYIESRFRG
jgi:hypothetical protein